MVKTDFIGISNVACVHISVFASDPDVGRSHVNELSALRGTNQFHSYVRDLQTRRIAAMRSAFGESIGVLNG